MNHYQELVSKKAEIEAELKRTTPPELWVCFYADDKYPPESFVSEHFAKANRPSLVSKIVRYVLPEEVTPPRPMFGQPVEEIPAPETSAMSEAYLRTDNTPK